MLIRQTRKYEQSIGSWTCAGTGYKRLCEQGHKLLRLHESFSLNEVYLPFPSRIILNANVSLDFVEVETPLLFKSTPEGAREFLVPTRKKGLFYALPQSPQQVGWVSLTLGGLITTIFNSVQYKQILMASGIDRYFQLAKCFRDESHTPDRQSEFTQVHLFYFVLCIIYLFSYPQIDIEMAFADAKTVTSTVESLIKRVWKQVLGVELGNFPRMKFSDAIALVCIYFWSIFC
jgi:aspartyl-tRNA synthetase